MRMYGFNFGWKGGKTRPDKFLYYVVAVGRNDGLFGLAERLCSNTTILLE